MKIPSLKSILYPFLLALLALLPEAVHAQQKKSIVLRKVLDGAEGRLAADSSVQVQDSIFYDTGLAGKLDTPYPVRNIITFRINEYSNRYIPQGFNASVNLRIYYSLPDQGTDSVDQVLEINYDTAQAYRMRSSFVFNNAHKVTVKVLQVTAPQPMLAVLMVENEMEVQPRYKMDCVADAPGPVGFTPPSGPGTPDELKVFWNAVTGADAYDLEWAWVDSSTLAAGRYGLPPYDARLIFLHNTTRVTVAENTYAIPLMYDGKGKLFLRVRAVQVKDEHQLLETAWSSDVPGGMTGFDFGGHQTNLNWQSSITFAEDGKRKVITQYYDGSLRARQTVTKDNTSQTTVVAETLYDYQGRPAIQVMPAPTMNTVMQYVRNINSNINGQEYDKDHYDHLENPIDYITGSAKPMGSSSGANQYYSPNNPLLADGGHHQYIPNAFGRAFSETEYTPDNTGRIARQGGVGETFKLGSGHETKYFYGSASQEELDAIFGTEAGHSSHYFKNMVADANGQYSVTYVDMHGRTVATALSWMPGSGHLAPLPEMDSADVVNRIGGSGLNIVEGRSITSKKSQQVAQYGKYTFNYQLTPPVLRKKDCNGVDICYTAGYELRIRVTDDAYNLKLGGQAFDTVIISYDINNMLTDCAQPQTISVSFDKWLLAGNYEITKTLTVSKEAMDFYRDSVFLQSNVCTTLEGVIEGQKEEMRLVDCRPSCDSCVARLGEWEPFRLRYMTDAGIAATDTASYRAEAWQSYQESKAACRELCYGPNLIDEIRRGMISDLTPPMGQYADTTLTAEMDYSIFNLESLHSYKQASIVYLDPNGKKDSVWLDDQQIWVVPNQLGRDAFIANFQQSWAENLLPKHPEYCRLQAMEQYRASLDWEYAFEQVETYAEAKAKGYLNPTGLDTVPFPKGNDPMVALVGTDLNNNMRMLPSGYSIWTTAAAIVKCDGTSEACFTGVRTPALAFSETGMCAGDLDMAWRNFRTQYINIRSRVMYDKLKNVVCDVSVKDLEDRQFEVHIRNPADALAGNPLGGMTGGIPNKEAAQAESDRQEKALYESNCQSYVENWVRQLKACGQYTEAGIRNEIIPELVKVCQEGSDRNHPMGASSIRPNSVYHFRSFEDVINDFNQRHQIETGLACNGGLITAPLPHGKQPVQAEKKTYTKPSDCECTTLQLLVREYEQRATAEDSTLSAYLERSRGAKIRQATLNILLDACSPAGPANCTYLPSPVAIPALIQCGVAPACVPCEEVKSAYDEYAGKYPAIMPGLANVDSLQQVKNDFFARFMNNRFGYGKLAWEYLTFLDSCAVQPAEYANLTEGDKICVEGEAISQQLMKLYTQDGKFVVQDIKRTPDNFYILAGQVPSQEHGDAGLIKTDANGNLIWSRSFGAEAFDEFTKVTPTADSGFVAIGVTRSYCYDYGAILIAKFDSAGNLQWNKTIEPEGIATGAYGTDIIQLSDRKFAFGGIKMTNLSHVGWIAGVLDESGMIEWAHNAGSSESRFGLQLKEQGQEIMGLSAMQMPGGLSPVVVKWSKATGAFTPVTVVASPGMQVTPKVFISADGGFKFSLVSSGDSNPFGAIVDLHANGTINKATRLGYPGTGHGDGPHVSPASDGGYYVVQGNGDVIIQRLRPDYSVQWARQARMEENQFISGSIINQDGSISVGGTTGNQIAFFLKTTANGWTGCSDSTLQLESTDISHTYSTIAMPAQIVTALNSDRLSVVVVGERANLAVQTALNCAGNDSCTYVTRGLMLCGNAAPVFEEVVVGEVSNCSDSTYFAVSAGQVIYKAIVDSVRNDFDFAYLQEAQTAAETEQFTVSYKQSEYHYTLYYYDQAGNLVKTVPPAGVKVRRAQTWLDSVAAARRNGEMLVPGHTMATNYRFNTLNNMIARHTPEMKEARYWYDRGGRQVLMQNARQKVENKFNYIIYDVLGRSKEIGEMTGNAQMTNEISRSPFSLDNWMYTGRESRTSISVINYDFHYSPIESLLLNATNLRGRVSWSANYDNASDLTSGVRNSGSFFSYDVLGYVKTVIQDYNSKSTQDQSNRYKKIGYKYDLISGNIKQVSYQEGESDAFYHRYDYDSESRLISSETSADGVYWDKEAHQYYYRDGGLARIVLGQQQVQGLDFAYTLLGWLKGVNSTTLGPQYDIGGDGGTGSYTATDAVGFANHYFGAWDYNTISARKTPFAAVDETITPYYNGMIGGISLNNPKAGVPLLFKYSHDVLGRMISMEVKHGLNGSLNQWAPINVDDFKEAVEYDPNGNIMKYNRNGNNTWGGSPLLMDDLEYNYISGANQLDHVIDHVSESNYSFDIDSQLPGNYSYDEIGNLIQDKNEGILEIKWTPFGKVRKIVKSDGTIIDFMYSVSGNRISKKVGDVETRYIYDGANNVLGIYVEGDTTVNAGKLSLVERPIYGSKRLGILRSYVDMSQGDITPIVPLRGLGIARIVGFERGKRNYELTNHLETVIASVSDRRKGLTANGTTVDRYEPDVTSANDYYPFGMQMPGRKFGNTDYRYGFQAQEGDHEIRGEGNSWNYAYRMHDPRIGRFFATDPLQDKYPWNSPYAFSENKVIHAVELEGLEAHVLTEVYDENKKHKNSSFAWDVNAPPVDEGELHYRKVYSQAGGNHVISSVEKAEDIDYKGGKLMPTPAPSSVFNTLGYYKFRHNDYNIRHTLMDTWYKIQPNAPSYYMDYGDKYATRFTFELRPKLSRVGQQWLDDTRMYLQQAIELELMYNPQIEEQNNLSFNIFAYGSHVQAYINGGLFDLPISDLIMIVGTPDLKDLLKPLGMYQMVRVAYEYNEFSKENRHHLANKIVEWGMEYARKISDERDKAVKTK